MNWYVKRLINCGYVKFSHLDRTRLRFQMTPQCMSILIQRTLKYLKRSLTVYNELRQKAKAIVNDLISQGITYMCLEGVDEVIDILRLTCIEEGTALDVTHNGIVLAALGINYEVVSQDAFIR